MISPNLPQSCCSSCLHNIGEVRRKAWLSEWLSGHSGPRQAGNWRPRNLEPTSPTSHILQPIIAHPEGTCIPEYLKSPSSPLELPELASLGAPWCVSVRCLFWKTLTATAIELGNTALMSPAGCHGGTGDPVCHITARYAATWGPMLCVFCAAPLRKVTHAVP